MSGEGHDRGRVPGQDRGPSWLLGFGVSLAALTIAVWGLDTRAFAEIVRGAAYPLLLPAFLLQLTGIAARAQGWRCLLGPAIPFRRAFAALNEGYLLNNILPFRLGELGRAYLVGHGTPIGASRALGSIVVERMIDVFVAVATILATVPLLAPPAWAARLALGAGAGLVLAAAGLALAYARRSTLTGWLRRTPGRLRGRLAGWLERFLSGLQEARGGARLGRGVVWLLIGWAIAWVQFGLYLRMFGAPASLQAAWFGLGVVALGGGVPSSPGGIGVYELAGVAALRFLGQTQEVALGVVLAAHLVQFSLTVVLGSLALASEGRSLRDLARAARNLVVRPAA